MSFWLVVTFDAELWEISLRSLRVTLTALVIAQVIIPTPVIASIAHETAKGDFALALGLGVVLLGLAILVNLAIHTLSRTEREGRWHAACDGDT